MNNENAKPVVIGVDGTEGSTGALRYAAQQASERDCGLLLVHVSPRYEVITSALPYVPHPVEATGRTILNEARLRALHLYPGLVIDADLRNGHRIAQLINAAAGGQVIVLGRESHTGAVTGLFGATTAAVVARTTVPATVVPETWQHAPDLGPVVVGLRGPEHANELLQTAFLYAAAHSVGVDVVHAWEIPAHYTHRLPDNEHANKWLPAGIDMVEQALAAWRSRYPQVPVSVRVVYADPGRSLMVAAKGASLMTLIRQPESESLGAHLGTTSRLVIAAAPCPIHVLPSPQEQLPLDELELERSGALPR